MALWTKLAQIKNSPENQTIWFMVDTNGKTVYQMIQAPLIPLGTAGYYRFKAMLNLKGYTFEDVVFEAQFLHVAQGVRPSPWT